MQKELKDKMTREELIKLATKIAECEGTEKEIDNMTDILESNLPDSGISDLIYYPDESITTEEIIDIALARISNNLNKK